MGHCANKSPLRKQHMNKIKEMLKSIRKPFDSIVQKYDIPCENDDFNAKLRVIKGSTMRIVDPIYMVNSL